MPPNPLAKRQPILRAARSVFLQHGYAGASMGVIADRAAVSKTTLYSHYGSKQALFAAVVGAHCEAVLETLIAARTDGEDPLRGLEEFARNVVGLCFAPDTLDLFRLVAAEGAAFPELAEMLFLCAHQPLRRRLAEYLRELDGRGCLRIADTDTAAQHFLGMLKGELYLRSLLGLQPRPSEEEKESLIRSAVDLLFRAYRP
jgi:TetR/AcrR family transcriptional repressor of mexJK operon